MQLTLRAAPLATTMFHGARILVAPLDWGLGHSTRCIPIIRRLLDLGATPIIGADAGPLALLSSEFPELEHARIPGVNIRYGAGRSQLWSMARQFPAMVRSVQAEKALFDRIRHDLRLDAVISDQRFGIRHTDLPSVLVTHQVFPFTPFAQSALRKLNLRHMERFDRCWIMDEPQAPGLAGELSHGASIPSNASYIGALSRLDPDAPPPGKRYRVVAVFSGPEPQRTMLENLLTEQLAKIPGEHLMVCGRPADSAASNTVTNGQAVGRIDKVPHLGAAALASHMVHSEVLISRSGYTTLMDLATLGRTALIIPTPGQAEQEYLGRLHTRTGRFLVRCQDKLDLREALPRSDQGLVAPPRRSKPLLDAALHELSSLLR